MPPVVGVLALQGDVREHRRTLAELGADTVEVRRPEQLDRVDALVLPGGESTTMSVLLQTSGLLDPLRDRLAGGMPAFGTCAGMILLSSEILDGRPDQVRLAALDVTVRRNAFGRQVDSFETDLDVRGLGAPVHAVFIRAPVVERAGPDVEVLATVEADGTARPVIVRRGPVWAAAFHPELTGERRVHQAWLHDSGLGAGTVAPSTSSSSTT
ncbi:MAG TPA: pyridoxal 5'-phosphate synthase glutaminase subunit PdxT [Acidimicrobiales bacterium]|nr:pyridoxal 5'-phosphate synthase glutaminase subunit PdxT [Acidimicrobiales bacterium]